MKLAAVVVTYNPNVEEAVNNIKQYIDHVDTLIVWENAPLDNVFKIKLEGYSHKIIYKGTGKNEGIGFALNRAVEWAVENNYSCILTMDQDSFFENFQFYKKKVEQYFEITEIGIFSPIIKSPIIKGESNIENEGEDIQLIEKSITSGSIYNINLFNKIGLFKEEYFIDVIDTEFCLRAKKNGYLTVAVTGAFLKQEFGSLTKSRLGFTSRNYSPFRLYFIIRNSIWFWKEYSAIYPFREKRYFVSYIFIQSFKIAVHESNKFQKYKSMLKGIYHGIRRSN